MAIIGSNRRSAAATWSVRKGRSEGREQRGSASDSERLAGKPPCPAGAGYSHSRYDGQRAPVAFSTVSARKDVIADASECGSSARAPYPSRARCSISLSLISTLARRSPRLRR